MPKLKTVKLPKQYIYEGGVTNPLYKRFHGWEKLSVSQINSFTDEQYKGGYYAGYFLKLPDEGNIFAKFGSMCGTHYETDGVDCHEYLSPEDIETLKKLPRPKTARYETEVVLDLEPFGLAKTCMQGFIDSEDEPEPKKVIITDLKTGNHKDKLDYYGSLEYSQTTFYSYVRDLEGYEILGSQVYLLERLGNTLDKTAFNKTGNPLWLRLSGKMEVIPTPYSRERAEKYLKSVAKTAVEISDAYAIFNKYFK